MLKEIFLSWNEEVTIQGFSINKKSGGYEIRIMLTAGESNESSKIIRPIIEKHGYEQKELDGFSVIFDPHAQSELESSKGVLIGAMLEKKFRIPERISVG